MLVSVKIWSKNTGIKDQNAEKALSLPILIGDHDFSGSSLISSYSGSMVPGATKHPSLTSTPDVINHVTLAMKSSGLAAFTASHHLHNNLRAPLFGRCVLLVFIVHYITMHYIGKGCRDGHYHFIFLLYLCFGL